MRAPLIAIALAFFCVYGAPAQQAQQPTALMNTAAAGQLADRVLQLIESTAVAVPGLTRASAPALEGARQSMKALQASPQHAGLTYDFLNEVRAYLAVADATPKPFPFPDAARRQFTELRDAADRIEAHFRALLDVKEAQQRNPDRDNLKRYADANAKLNPPANLPRVVFLGDSITDGWRLNEYFTGRDFVNRGISGQITGEMLGRMQADVIDLHPKAMLVLAGTNDIARGVPVKTIENNLMMLADLAQAHNIRPLFASILPVSDYHKDVNPRFEMTRARPPSTIRQINQWLQQYCSEHGYTYVDYYDAMVDSGGLLQADLADDGLHPNAKGYRIMAPIALEALGRVLMPSAPAAPPRKRRIHVF